MASNTVDTTATSETVAAPVVSWKVANLERETSDGFVYIAHYTVDIKDDAYSAGAYGSIGFERPEGKAALTSYSDLTEEQVIGWVKEKLGEEKVAEIEAALELQLAEQHQPTKAAGVPWAA